MTTIPDSHTLEKTITQLVLAALGKGAGNPKPDEPLLSTQAGFDSFALLEFILRLEDAFNISIPDEDLDIEIFYSIETIASYIRVRMEEDIERCAT